MTDDSTKGYLRILTQALRPGSILPFGCYVYLKVQSRMLPYVVKDNEFSDAKASKLSQFGYHNVYIKDAEKPAYFAYLDQFLMTEQGQKILKELAVEAGGLNNVGGLPAQGEYSLKALKTLGLPEAGV